MRSKPSFYFLYTRIVLLLCCPIPVVSQPNEDMRLGFGSVNWSPDGEKIAFTAIRVKKDWSDYNAEKWGLFVYEVNAKKMAKIDNGVIYASFSPDGKKIAYDQNMAGHSEIFVYHSTDHSQRNITNYPSKDFAPAWSPNGKRIAFNSDRDGTVGIYVMREDGTGITRITQSGGFKSYNPEWSPKDNNIVYYFEKGDNKDQIHLTDAVGSFHRNISNDENHNYFPGWAPDGKVIYTMGEDAIFTMNSDGTNKAPITGIRGFYARYLPKGQAVAYLNEPNQAIYLSKLVDGKVQDTTTLVNHDSLSAFLK